MASDQTISSSPSLSVDIQIDQGAFTLDASFVAGTGITVISGPSGAGKSTLISAIAGAVKPDAGSIRLGDQVFYDHAESILMDLREKSSNDPLYSLMIANVRSVRDGPGEASDSLAQDISLSEEFTKSYLYLFDILR